MNLVTLIRERRAVIGVLGLGYVGLPLVSTFADRGFRVIGLDTDESKVQSLLAGRSYIQHIPHDTITTCLANGFTPTTDFSRAALCDVVLICVPTPLTEHWEPDLQYVVASSETLARYARPGQLIILESTTWPGTTDEVMRPIFEKAGHKVGTDVFLAFSPEREDPGNAKFSARNIPKVVGADDPEALEAAVAVYQAAIEAGVVPVSSTRAAEATKILENTFRSVNIALVNELKMIFTRMGIDVWEVINAASTKPFGFMKFTPGPGLGGHCIPIDPFYLTWKAREFDLPTRFIEMAGEVNRGMPQWVVDRTMLAFSDAGRGLAGSRILLIGLAYKKNVDDARESPSYKLIELFEKRGCKVDYHDDYLPVIPPSREHGQYAGRTSQPLERAGEYDAVVISTDHDYIDYDALLQRARLVIDSRGVYRQADPKVVKA